MEPFWFEVIFGKLVQSFASPALDIFFSLVTLLGNPAFWMFFAAYLFWRGEEKKSFVMTAMLMFVIALTSVIKPLIGRIRPSPEEFRVLAFDAEGRYSIPSTHAGSAGAIAAYFHSNELRWKGLLLLMVVMVMLSRVYLGAHYLLDVIIGALLGFALGTIIRGVEENFPKIQVNRKRVLEETGVISFLMLGIGTTLVFRSFWVAAFFFGYFTGVFLLKLMNYDSEKKLIVGKMVFGVAGLVVLILIGEIEFIKPESYFIAGFWVTFLCPLAYFFLIGQGLEKKEEEKPKWPKKLRQRKMIRP